MNEKSRTFLLEPEVAGKMPLDKIGLTLKEWCRAFGLTPEEGLTELRSGRIAACGHPDGQGGYTDMLIRCDEVIRWMVDNNRDFKI